MSALYLSAPLPFVGQKRMFAKHFIEVIRQYPPGTVFVDLFGGFGLLSHITKHFHPESRVIYNDFDNYRHRINNIERTNRLLSRIRPISDRFKRHKPITGESREQIFRLLEQEEQESGYIDFITLSSSLMFSMKYKLSIEDMRSEVLYNNVRKSDYAPCPDYLAGLEIESCDYRELFERFKDTPGVVFLVDPPYLSTDVEGPIVCIGDSPTTSMSCRCFPDTTSYILLPRNRASSNCASGWDATPRSETRLPVVRGGSSKRR